MSPRQTKHRRLILYSVTDPTSSSQIYNFTLPSDDTDDTYDLALVASYTSNATVATLNYTASQVAGSSGTTTGPAVVTSSGASTQQLPYAASMGNGFGFACVVGSAGFLVGMTWFEGLFWWFSSRLVS